MSTPDIQPKPELPPRTPDQTPPRKPEEEDAPNERPAEDVETPDDVEPGSDADIDRGGSGAREPSPGEVSTGQQDDNIDDLGRRPDGKTEEQPGAEGVA